MRLLALLLTLSSAAFAAPPPITWSPTDHSEFTAVAGATQTRLGSFGSIFVSGRSSTSQRVGVRYVELVVGQIGPNGVVFGLANGIASPNNFPGSDLNGVGYRMNGNVMKGSAWVGVAPLPPPFTTGDVLGMQVDFGAHTVRFRKGAGGWSGAVDITSLGTDVYVSISLGAGLPEASVQLNPADNWNDFPWPTMNIVAIGDSMTNNGAVLDLYVQRLVDMIAANRVGWAQGYHFGINGATWNFAWSEAGYPYSINQDIPMRAVPALSPALPNWVILFAGTNGDAIFHDTAANQYVGLLTAISILQAVGVRADHIIVNTMLPRTNEAFRTAYNAAIVADANHIGYRIARLDLDPHIGCATCNLNAAYFQGDHVHPTDAGHGIIAQIDYAVMTFP